MTCDHSPRFQILCYFAREDGEICGDVMELEMECCSPHKVCVCACTPTYVRPCVHACVCMCMNSELDIIPVDFVGHFLGSSTQC